MKTTVVRGPEYDAALQRRVMEALRELRAEVSSAEHMLGGSQLVVSREAKLDGRSVSIESETYVGLSLAGDADLVDRIAAIVRRSGGE